jgi:hypothetical protein
LQIYLMIELKGLRIAIAAGLIGSAALVAAAGQPAATLTAEAILSERLGLPAAEVARFAAGEIIARNVPATADEEIAGVGAVRGPGDLRRLLAWLHDIESFMRAAGTQNVGGIKEPASAADLASVNLDDVDFSDLASCRPGRCEVRMPAAYLARFQKEVNFTAPDARTRAGALTRELLADYVSTYQKGGDAAIGALHNPQAPAESANRFRDMLRRSTKVWDLAYPFVSYLETYPAAPPEKTVSKFYWTRDKVGLKPALTLHHVVIQEFPDGRVLVADKQFYASRQIDAALVIALGIPTADMKGYDLIVSVKARADGVSGVTGRMLRGRIEREMTDGLRNYLTWIRDSMKLG